MDKVSHCTLELQIEPGAVAGDDEVRLSVWTTSFAEVEDDGVRASAWMSNYVCFLFEHDESYLDVSDLRHSSSGLNAYHQSALLEGCSLRFYSEAETLHTP